MNEKNGEHPFGHAGQFISLGVFLVVWITDSFYLRLSTYLSDHVSLAIRLVAAVLIVAIAVSLFESGHVVVRHDQRPSGVVTTGAFRYVRHPLYLASIMTYIGLAVSTLSLFSFGVLAGIFFFHNYIASYEERLMEARLGEEYRQYKDRTGKWVPKIK